MRTPPLSFHAFFTRAALAAVAAVASLTACSSPDTSGDAGTSTSGDAGTSDRHLDVSKFQKICSSGLGDMKPTPPVDYLAIVASGGLTQGPPIDATLDAGSPDAAGSDAAPPPAGPSYDNRLSFTGVPCATATNRAACEAKLAAASAPRGPTDWSSNAGYSRGTPQPEPSYTHYVYTRGDEVGALATRAELVAFLAPIETVAEAISMLNAPYLGGCASVRSDPEGFAFFTTYCTGSSDYPVETIRLLLRDGSTRELERSQPKDAAPGACPRFP